jgi:hypothetical protein
MTVDRFGNRHAPNLPYGAEDKIRAEGPIHQGNLGRPIREGLAKADPGNADWQRDLALSYGRVAFIEMRQGVRDDALKAFRQGRDIITQLMWRSPDNATLSKDLAWFDTQMDIHDK